MLYVQFKANVVSGAFISYGLIGEEVTTKGDSIVLKEAAAVYEVPVQDENKNTVVRLQVTMSSQISNNDVTVSKSDVLLTRKVESDDELLILKGRSKELLLAQKEELKKQLAEAN